MSGPFWKQGFGWVMLSTWNKTRAWHSRKWVYAQDQYLSTKAPADTVWGGDACLRGFGLMTSHHSPIGLGVLAVILLFQFRVASKSLHGFRRFCDGYQIILKTLNWWWLLIVFTKPLRSWEFRASWIGIHVHTTYRCIEDNKTTIKANTLTQHRVCILTSITRILQTGDQVGLWKTEFIRLFWRSAYCSGNTKLRLL